MAEGAKFDHILLGARGTTASGTCFVSDAGITWKKDGVRERFPKASNIVLFFLPMPNFSVMLCLL
jgi:hypothetical protein